MSKIGNPLYGIGRSSLPYNAADSDAPWQWDGLVAAHPIFLAPYHAITGSNQSAVVGDRWPILGSNPGPVGSMTWYSSTSYSSATNRIWWDAYYGPGLLFAGPSANSADSVCGVWTPGTAVGGLAIDANWGQGTIELIWMASRDSASKGILNLEANGNAAVSNYLSTGTANSLTWSTRTSATNTLTINNYPVFGGSVLGHSIFTWQGTNCTKEAYYNGEFSTSVATGSPAQMPGNAYGIGLGVSSSGTYNNWGMYCAYLAIYSKHVGQEWVTAKYNDPYGLLRRRTRFTYPAPAVIAAGRYCPMMMGM